MNLHSIVSGVISSINPMTDVTIQVSAGYTIAPDGKQVPAYTTLTGIKGQKQALSYGDIQRINGLNIQGVTEKMYLTGNFEGVFRALGKGGDLISFNGRTYLVNIVFERWPDWCCVGLTMQVAP